MSFLNGAQGTVIEGHFVTMVAYSGLLPSDRGFEILCQTTRPSAFYGFNEFDLAKDFGCLHGTRLDIQDHIFKWLNNPEGEVAMWLHGPAGSGKTAIAQTIAKFCEEREQLSSMFFFSQSDRSRDSAKHLVPTLAFGMLQQMRHMRDTVCIPIAENPHLFSASLERQIKTIILPAISEPFPSSENTQPGPMLFIIDGLDECTDAKAQESIIRLFVLLLAATTTTVRHKILILSRPESHIVSAFSAEDIASHVHHLCLDEWKSSTDIEIFLRAELETIKRTHPMSAYLDDWPSPALFQRLLHKSLNSFAYATSAIRYTSSHDRHPNTSLKNLLGLGPDRAFEAHAQLDMLYRHILNSLEEKTRRIAQMILCLYAYLSVDKIETLSVLLGEETCLVELVMIKVSAVIRLDKITRRISYHHISFGDFLLNKERSGTLYLYDPDIAIAVAKALSRLWLHAGTAKHHDTDDCKLYLISRRFSNTSAMDMHIHVLETFLATFLPQTSVIPPDCPSKLAECLGEFFYEIWCQSVSKQHSAPLTLLFCEAFDHLTTWLRSHLDAGQGGRSLDIVLDIIFHLNGLP